MAHDASKVLMGNVTTTFKHIQNAPGVIEAGKLVRLKSDNTISVAAADGQAIGISCGLPLDGTAFTDIVKAGTHVPVLLTAAFSPVIGAQVFISDTTGMAIASGAGSTGINATYMSGALTAMKENKTEVASGCALIAMPGGV